MYRPTHQHITETVKNVLCSIISIYCFMCTCNFACKGRPRNDLLCRAGRQTLLIHYYIRLCCPGLKKTS